MSYPNDTKIVFKYLVLILLKIAPFESSNEKENIFSLSYFHNRNVLN